MLFISLWLDVVYQTALYHFNLFFDLGKLSFSCHVNFITKAKLHNKSSNYNGIAQIVLGINNKTLIMDQFLPKLV